MAVLEAARLRAASAEAMPKASPAAAEAVLEAARLRAASAEATPKAPAAAEPPAARPRRSRRRPVPGPTLTGIQPPSRSAIPRAPKRTGAPPATGQHPSSKTMMAPTKPSAATVQPTSPAIPQGPSPCRSNSSHAACRSTTRHSSTNRNSWLVLAPMEARDNDKGCRRQSTYECLRIVLVSTVYLAPAHHTGPDTSTRTRQPLTHRCCRATRARHFSRAGEVAWRGGRDPDAKRLCIKRFWDMECLRQTPQLSYQVRRLSDAKLPELQASAAPPGRRSDVHGRLGGAGVLEAS